MTVIVGGQPKRESWTSEFASVFREGKCRDAREFLASHPELGSDKDLTLDIMYEEFCLRREAGETVKLSTFCDRFPTYRHSLRKLLSVDKFVDENAPEPTWPEPGDALLGFEIHAMLGRGTLARVYLARQPRLGNRWVAVKFAVGGDYEADTLGRLNHDGVVPVYGVEDDPGTGMTAVCMPYLGSCTLADVLDELGGHEEIPGQASFLLDSLRKRERFGESLPDVAPPHPALVDGAYADAVLLLGLRLAEALSYTHRQRVFHRDLKPSNVLLTPHGVPKLLDFNLSEDHAHSKGRVGGTLPYMPPEQICDVFRLEGIGVDDAVDGRADIYALGVILYELLTGQLPFGSPDGYERVHAEADLERKLAECVSPHERNSQVSRAFSDAIMACLAPNPTQRPSTAEALADILRELTRATSASAELVAGRPSELRRRHFLAGLAGAFAVVTIAAGAALYRAAHQRPSGTAIEEMANLAMSHVEMARVEFELGVAAYETKQWDTAIEAFDSALEMRPDWDEALFARGQTHRMAGRNAEAIRDYVQARDAGRARDNADHVEIDLCLGWCYFAMGKYADAKEAFLRAKNACHENQAAVCNNLACAIAGMTYGELPALEEFDRAITLDPGLRLAYANSNRVAPRVSVPPKKTDTAMAHYRFAVLESQQKQVDRESLAAHLKRAVELGWPRDLVDGRGIFSRFQQDPWFVEVWEPSAPEHIPMLVPPPMGSRLIHPID